jgi:hypothetical protein
MATPPTVEQQRAWMAQWQSAAAALAAVRQQELETADLWRIASDLEDACVASARRAAADLPATSGLVEQQRLFHRREHV